MGSRAVVKAGAFRAHEDVEARRILIVEDDIDARLVMEEFLAAQGFASSVTKTVDEALALLRSGLHYDLLLLDLMLPGRDGSELLELRDRDPSIRLPPVVVVSAFAPPAMDGAAAVFQKPVDLAELHAAIERLLPPHRRRSAQR